MERLGRPAERRETVILSVSIEASTKHKLSEVARREGKSRSKLVETLVEDYLKKHGSGNPAFGLNPWVRQPDFVALPTLGEAPTKRSFDKLTPQEKKLVAKSVKAWKRFLDPEMRELDWKWEW